MPIKKDPKRSHQDQDDHGLERIIFFSDAVMAIAITLLAIDLRLPELTTITSAAELPLRLSEMNPKIVSFVISFVVIALYWTSHHRYFHWIKRYDSKLIVLNFLFLFFIVLMPFAASLFQYNFLFLNSFIQYNVFSIGIFIYAAEVAAIGFSIGALWWYASHHHRLIDENLDDEIIRRRNLVGLIIPSMFLISLPIAIWNWVYAVILWWLTPLVLIFTMRSGKSRRK